MKRARGGGRGEMQVLFDKSLSKTTGVLGQNFGLVAKPGTEIRNFLKLLLKNSGNYTTKKFFFKTVEDYN